MYSKFSVLSYVILWGNVESVYFDQRQNGDLNVQVDLKDVSIIAVLTGDKEEYVDYDYAYDYSQLTIKPQNRTTPKPLSTTSTTVSENLLDSTIIETTISYENANSTLLEISNTTQLNDTNEISVSEANSTTAKYVTENVTQAPNLVSASAIKNTTLTTNLTLGIPICRKGFVVNDNNECQPKVNSTENALIKLVKLSQRLKLRRENKSNEN